MKFAFAALILLLAVLSIDASGYFYVPETKKAFRQFDGNRDEIIENAEFQSFMQKFSVSEQDAFTTTDSADIDKNGEISFNEFVSALRRAKEPNFSGLRAFDLDNNGYIRGKEILDTVGEENVI